MTDAPTLDEAAVYTAAIAANANHKKRNNWLKREWGDMQESDRADVVSDTRAAITAYLTATAKPQPVVVTDEMARDAKGVFERAFGTGEAMRTALEWFVRTHLSPSPASQGGKWMPIATHNFVVDGLMGLLKSANSTRAELEAELEAAARPPEPKPEPFAWPVMFPVRRRNGTPSEQFAMLFMAQDQLDRYREFMAREFPDYEIGGRIEPSFPDSAKVPK